jgi:hypothetical protein
MLHESIPGGSLQNNLLVCRAGQLQPMLSMRVSSCSIPVSRVRISSHHLVA